VHKTTSIKDLVFMSGVFLGNFGFQEGILNIRSSTNKMKGGDAFLLLF